MDRYTRYTSSSCGCNDNMNTAGLQRYGSHTKCDTNSSLAMVSIPMQKFENICSASEALEKGTLFSDLYKPHCIRGGCRC